jgi:hypothetical protein
VAYPWTQVHGAKETAAQRSRLQAPSLSFYTDYEPFEAFAGVLELLDEVGFDNASRYIGPNLGLGHRRGDPPPVHEVVAAVRGLEGAKLPWSGLRARLVYTRRKKVYARIKVKGNSPTRVTVKVKGAVYKRDWNKFKSLTKKEMDPRDDE